MLFRGTYFSILLALCFIFCVGNENQQVNVHVEEDVLKDGTASGSGTQFLLKDLKLTCDVSKADLEIIMALPFHGVIYPENQPRCRLYGGNGNSSFHIPLSPDGCGHHELFNENFIEYRLAVQWDTLLVGPDDFLLVVRCEEQSSYNKSVTFDLSGDQIGNAHSRLMKQINPSVWMEIGNGWGPKSPSLDHAVPAGNPLTLAVRLMAMDAWFDVDIMSCKAGVPDEHGDVDLEEGLLILDGSCSARPYFVGHTYKERRREDNSYVAHVFSHFTAFRFARSALVVMSCDVMVCFWRCPERATCSDVLVPRKARAAPIEGNVMLPPRKLSLQRTFVVQGIGQEIAAIRDFSRQRDQTPHRSHTALVMTWVVCLVTFSILSVALTVVLVRRCSLPPMRSHEELFVSPR